MTLKNRISFFFQEFENASESMREELAKSDDQIAAESKIYQKIEAINLSNRQISK